MKTIKHTSNNTIDITDEQDNTKEWVSESLADTMKDEFDKSRKMKIEGRWYVTRAENGEDDEN